MSVINKAHVKKLALDVAAKERPAVGFSRVSGDFMEAIEAATRAAVIARVKQQPSRGVTLT